MTSALSLRTVALVSNGARVVDHANVELELGQAVAIVGPNGCGKSSVARLAAGLLSPSEGRVSVFGEDLAALSADGLRRLRGRIGLVLQGGSLFADLNVEDNLRLALGPVQREPDGRAERRLDRLLVDFGLEQAYGQVAGDLSAGQRRRLELARAFARDPDLLILDEPFEGADPAAARDLEQRLATLLRRRPRALLLSTYDIDLARRFSSTVLGLSQGRLERLEPVSSA